MSSVSPGRFGIWRLGRPSLSVNAETVLLTLPITTTDVLANLVTGFI